MITVRKATPEDYKDFAELMLISAPYFPILFGDKIKDVLQDLFRQHSNLFSFEHVYFAEVGGEKAGMILGYSWQVKKQENLRTGFLLFKKIGVRFLSRFSLMMKLNATLGRVDDGEYYVSNIAAYPRHSGRGVGKKLILQAEQDAKMVGDERIVLDVENENIVALSFYRNFGYKKEKEFLICMKGNKTLYFCRMAKEVNW